MRKYRKLLISALLLLGIAAAAGYWWVRRVGPATAISAGRWLLHGQGAPAALSRLPEGDLFFYADLRPVHLLPLKESKPLQLEGNYQQFVDQTGIQFERDLDEVAMSRRDISGGDVESSEIFVGRFDRARLSGYLQRSSTQTEDYRGHTIHSIPNEGHMVRVCVLDGSTVAVTNMASSEPMHGIIEGRQPQGGESSLLSEYIGRVPLGSLAWMIDRMPADSGTPQLPGGLSFGFLENTVAVVSLRYTDVVLLRADVFAPSEADARRVMNSASTLLLMYRSVGRSLGTRGGDPDVKAALDSIQIEQKGNAAILTATIPQRFLIKLVSDAQGGSSSAGNLPAPSQPRGKR